MLGQDDSRPLSPLVSHGVSGCWAEMMLLCLPLSPLVSHGMSGCWAEMMLLCLSLSPLLSSGCRADMILLCSLCSDQGTMGWKKACIIMLSSIHVATWEVEAPSSPAVHLLHWGASKCDGHLSGHLHVQRDRKDKELSKHCQRQQWWLLPYLREV